jgi:hypothetical protein
MNLTLKILIGVAAWHVIGAVAITFADDEENHLIQWVFNAPCGFDVLCVTLWPVVVYFYRFYRSYK